MKDIVLWPFVFFHTMLNFCKARIQLGSLKSGSWLLAEQHIVQNQIVASNNVLGGLQQLSLQRHSLTKSNDMLMSKSTCSCQIPGWSRFVPKGIVKVPIFMLIILRNSISHLAQSTTAHVD